MEPITTTNIKEIVQQFAYAVQAKDMEQVASLLADDGEYHTQDAALNTIEDSKKVAFLDWLRIQLSQKEVTKIEYDNCILCRTGNPVVFFNEGLFVLQQESKAKSRTGFMLHIVDGRIQEIMFCFSFAQRENKSQMEYDADEVKNLMLQGATLMEAVETVLAGRGCTDIWQGNHPGIDGPRIYIPPDLL